MSGVVKPPDIADVLRAAAEMTDDLTSEEMATLLREAAELIENLRKLVGIQNEILLENEPAAGSA
ncbi:hypothetical protein ACFQI3_04855 [Hansschlegelia quercus]|uniref:hypothetical protein n=1 Tax=Hansschlegelia quercus TaxID=2528245 RepID=UPI001FE130CB|nr:hypothetical protein [Hansschlegelia quercus]